MSCVTAMYGRDKSGKTHLGLTWPKPVLLDNDRRYYWLREKFSAAQFVECAVPVSLNGQVLVTNERAWQDHQEKLSQALQGPAETVIIDTFTTLRAIAFEVTPSVEKVKQVPFNRSWSNQRLRECVIAARHYKKHLVLVHYAAPEYSTGQRTEDRHPTGRDQLRGWADITYLADLVLHLQRTGPASLATIESCAWTKAAHGLVVPEPSYQAIMAGIANALKTESGL